MAYKAFLVDVLYKDNTNEIIATVEHRSATKTIIRLYDFLLPITFTAAKAIIVSANQALNQGAPTIVTTLENAIGEEIL